MVPFCSVICFASSFLRSGDKLRKANFLFANIFFEILVEDSTFLTEDDRTWLVLFSISFDPTSSHFVKAPEPLFLRIACISSLIRTWKKKEIVSSSRTRMHPFIPSLNPTCYAKKIVRNGNVLQSLWF